MDWALGSNLYDQLTREYILPNLRNYGTSALPSASIPGRLAYDSTLSVPTSDDGSGWRPVMTRFLTRTASHIEATQATAPTVSACTGGTVATGSTDVAGEITGITGTVCTLNFDNRYANTPFAVVGTSSATGGNNQIRFNAYTTGLDLYNLAGSAQDVGYLVIGRY